MAIVFAMVRQKMSDENICLYQRFVYTIDADAIIRKRSRCVVAARDIKEETAAAAISRVTRIIHRQSTLLVTNQNKRIFEHVQFPTGTITINKSTHLWVAAN